VISLIGQLDINDVVVSGGCRGPDTFAEEAAINRGMKTKIFRPNLKDIKDKGDMVKRYYSRNKEVAEASDVIYALVHPSRTGGTESTITFAQRLGKKVILI
jgi:predicted Rossmann fold nucleotide-binding protein DprA/Smf involved in DNA uptake